MSSLSQALFSAQSTDSNTRASSLKTLEDLACANPVEYIVNLSLEMSKSSSPSHVRQLAGILIKNVVNNSTKNPRLDGVWQSMDPQLKTQIRTNTLGTLAAEDKDVRLICSQTVAALACIDIPQGQWLEVFGILITNSTNVNPMFKISAIRTLGYICEGLPQKLVVKEQADQILTALATSLEPGETNSEIKLVALTAFRNSLKFISANMGDASERNIILGLLYSCCQDQKIDIRREAMMIICDVLSLYYDCIETNLFELGNLTYTIIKSDQTSVAIMAIEFWNQAADEEAERLRYQQLPCKNYINTAAASLVPLLLDKIHFTEQDSDEWTLHKACASTLGAISLITHDRILELVGGYITQEIKSEDWQKRISAAVIIGSIMEGLQNIQLLLQYTLQDLLNLLQDPVHTVKDTASWSISRLCEAHSNYLISNNLFNKIIEKVLPILDYSPKTATHGCWCILNLFPKGISNPSLSLESINAILEKLIRTSLRIDAHSTEHDLLVASYAAIQKIFEEVPDEIFAGISSKIEFFLKILEDSVNQTQYLASQAQIFSTLHAIFGRSQQGSVLPEIADRFVSVTINIFKSRGTVIEEGMQALGSLAENLRQRFEGYVEALIPFVYWAVDNPSSSISKSGVMAIGDLSRAMGGNINKYVPDLVPKLLSILSNEQTFFDVKVRTIECLGDLASNNTQELSNFLPSVLNYMESASNHSVDYSIEQVNPDMHDYLLELRESIMSFYVGIVQGLNEIHATDKIFGYLPKIMDYSMVVVQDLFKPNVYIHRSVIGIIGDISNYYRSKAAPFMGNVKGYLSQPALVQNAELAADLIYANNGMKLI